MAQELLDKLGNSRRKNWIWKWITSVKTEISSNLPGKLTTENPVGYRDVLQIRPPKHNELLVMNATEMASYENGDTM